jgi:hypothetical protein
MHIKAWGGGGLNLFCVRNKGGAMPTETAIVITGIVLVFIVFAVALGWAAFYTRNVRTPGATYFDSGK